MNTPLVTVYIPTRNRLPLLKRAIESVDVQDYPAIELIVVDDGSTDGTWPFLEQMQKRVRFRAVRNPFPMGAPASRNIAIHHAAGEFITGLDDDDYFLPGRISAFVRTWQELQQQKEPFGFLFDSIRWLTPKGMSLIHRNATAELEDLRFLNVVGSQVFTEPRRIREAGLFSLEMPAWQDWDLWVRLASRHGKGISLQMATYVKDESHGQDIISRKPGFVMRHARDLFLARNQPFSRIQEASVTLFLCMYPQVRLRIGDLVRMLPVVLSWRHFWSRLLGQVRVNRKAVP